MDLADLWQEHKRFILSVVGALLLLLVGKGVLNATYPVKAVARECSNLNQQLRKDPEVKSSLVADLEAEVSAVKERLIKLKKEMEFVADPELKAAEGGSNVRAEYFKMVGRLQDVLVDVAERQGIVIPERLGLQDRAPTDPVEIQRSLRALNVIQNVVILCINAGIKSIDRIVIEEQERSQSSAFLRELRVEFEILGREDAVRRVLHDLVEGPRTGGQAFLEIAPPTRLEPTKGDRGTLKLILTVAALSISTEGIDLKDA